MSRKDPMELFLIRHGQSANNARPLSERVDDPSLTAIGLEQARCLGLWCRGLKLDRLLTSPFRRTLETTQQIHQFTGLVPEVWISLHEHGGCIGGTDPATYEGRPGMTRAQFEAEYSGYCLPNEVDGKGWWKCKPWETFEEMEKRAVAVAQSTIDRFGHAEERIAYVSHGGFLPILIATLLNPAGSGYEWLDLIPNTAVAKLIFEEGRARLSFYNSVIHLPVELVT